MSHFFYENPHLFEYFGLVLLLVLLFGISCLFPKTELAKKIFGLSLMLSPIVYFYLIIDAHLVNIPFEDDYVLLETIHTFRQETNFTEAVKILFAQVNQHRFAFERLVMLALVFFTGTVNIKVLITLGNLFLLGILYLFFLPFRQERVSWYYLIPVPFLLFNLTFYENAFWGIAAIQNTPLIFITLLSTHALSRDSPTGRWLGAFTALVATFISGTGMLAWIIGAIILGFQKKYKFLALWLLLTVGCLSFYFLFDYQFIQSGEAAKPWQHPIFNGLLFFGFLGNVLYLDLPHAMQQAFYPDMVACVFLGLFIGLVFLLWALRFFISHQLRSSYWLVLGAFLLGLGTAAMFVLSRPMNQFFMYGGNILSRRYMIFGAVLLAVAYVALVVLTKRLRYVQPLVLGLGMLGFLVINFISYHSSIIQLRKQHDELSLDAFYWKNYDTFLTQGNNFGDRPYWNHPTRMKELFASVESAGLSKVYASNSVPDADALAALAQNKPKAYQGTFSAKVSYPIAESNLPEEYIDFNTQNADGPAPTHFMLVSDKYVLPLPALPKPYGWAGFLKNKTYYSSQRQYGLYRSKLPSGQFQVWVILSGNGSGKSNGKLPLRGTMPPNSEGWELQYSGKVMKLTD